MQQDKELEKKVQERISLTRDNILSLDIVLEDGQAISHVGVKEREVIIYGCRTLIGCIGGVATRPEYRERGLATRLMKLAVQKVSDDQGDIMLVSGDRDLYRRRGCAAAAPIYRCHVNRSVAERFGASNVKIVPYREEDLLAIANIYQREPVRFHRDLREFRVMLERRTPAPFWSETEVFTLHGNGTFLGYIVVQEPRNEERGRGRIRAIAEYAGVRSAIVDSIGLLFARYNMEDLLLYVPEHDALFRYILKQRGIQGERRNLGGHTFKILNLPRLMDRLAFYIQERIGKSKADFLKFAQEGDSFSIAYKQEHLDLNDQLIAPLLFGTYDDTEKGVLPETGEMSKVMRALFPIPFLWPGLNSF